MTVSMSLVVLAIKQLKTLTTLLTLLAVLASQMPQQKRQFQSTTTLVPLVIYYFKLGHGNLNAWN